MSTLNTYNLKSPDSANTNLALDASGNVAIQAGSASTPSVYVTGDANTGLYSPGADQLALSTGGTGRLFIDSSGRVGLGSSTPQYALDLNSSASPVAGINSTNANGGGLKILNSGTDRLYIGSAKWILGGSSLADESALVTGGAYSLIFGTNGAERARIDSSGRLLVGTSTVTTTASTATNNSIALESTNNYSGVSFTANCNDSNGSYLVLKKSRGTSPGSTTVVQSGDEIGNIFFEATDGSASRSAASIRAFVDATPGASDMPGRLVFSTTADGASSPTERVRITNAGWFKASNTGTYTYAQSSHEMRSNNNDFVFTATNSNASPVGIQIYHITDVNGTGNEFLYCYAGSTLRASIRSNGGLANFSANNANLSDRNAKKDISLAADTWDCIKQWEIVNYRYKDQPDDSDLNLGVIAQQVAESCPEVITVFEEAKDDQPEKLGVKEQQMYWMAIKALQEAQVRIEALEAEVAALKAR